MLLKKNYSSFYNKIHFLWISESKLKNLEAWFFSVALYCYEQKSFTKLPLLVQGAAGRSLARSTSRCCRMKSIVSLERGVCSCAELQVFSCYRGWKEVYQVTNAISTTSRRKLSSSFFSFLFFLLQGKAPKEIHAILIETLGEHVPSYAIIKNWVVQLKTWWFFHL
jgi:hypothetical protein